jgi:hypothetical protein
MKKINLNVFVVGALLVACSSQAPAPDKIAPKSAARGGVKAAVSDTGRPIVDAQSFKPKKFVEIIFDASGSMGAELEGEMKIETAKNMLALIMKSMQEEQAAVSLTAFGHRKSWSCKDIERIYDLDFKTGEQIDARMKTIKPAERGKTPIAEALLRSYNRLKTVKGPKGIFVITDGAESCGGDPCKIALKLRKELDVQVYTLTYNPSSITEFKSLGCLGSTEMAKDKEELFKKMSNLKQAFDKDYAKKMQGLETIQTLNVLGPKRDAWAVAKSQGDGKEFRFLGVLGTSLPVGVYNITVQYNPPVTFENIELKANDKKTLSVVGEGALMLEIDFPGVELEAVNMLDSKKYRVMAGTEAKVPVGRYNVSGMTASGLAFQWLDQIVTPGSVAKLTLPNWALIEVKTEKPVTFDLFSYANQDAVKRAVRGAMDKNVSGIKRFKDSLGFFPTNAPHIVEVGEYTLVLSDGRKIDRLEVRKGEKKVELMR